MSKEQKSVTPFTREVVNLIRGIPKGKVATYGQIALLAGKPQGSRGVAWILNSSSNAQKLPWHRVINSQGRISFPKGSALFVKQRRLLRGESVEVDTDGRIDLKAFRWEPVRKKRGKRVQSAPRMFSQDD